MKENYTQLYPNATVAKAVSDYAFEHSSPLPKHITDHHAWGTESQERANFMISPLQAQFQSWFAKALGTKRVLEIGTFIGFSALGWADAVGPSSHVTALEYSPEYAAIAEETFVKYDVRNVDVVIGDARESIKRLIEDLSEPYDLIFIDADKTSYPTYLSLILELSPAGGEKRLLRKDGIIVADNILRRGLVADSSVENPWSPLHGEGKEKQASQAGMWRSTDLDAIDNFNKALVGNKRVDTFLMPMFDGLGMGRLVD